MEFSIKCKAMEFGKGNKRVQGKYHIGNKIINRKRRHECYNSGQPLALIYKQDHKENVCISYLNVEMIMRVISSMIRPWLEYAAISSSPHKKKDVRNI